MSRPALLEGIHVTDLTTVFFGPYCTQTLADLGAEVVKLEPADGDTARLVGNPPKTPGMGPVFMRLNRGKRNINWDLKSDAGREAMRRQLARSDVFIHNIRADAVDRLGLSYEAVKAIRPDIVYVHCTGFDQRGPYAALQAYDDIIQASTGLATLLPMADGNARPRFLPAAIADKVSGLHAVYGVLAAISHKLRTGEGQHVEVPMFESLVSFNTLEHLGHVRASRGLVDESLLLEDVAMASRLEKPHPALIDIRGKGDPPILGFHRLSGWVELSLVIAGRGGGGHEAVVA